MTESEPKSGQLELYHTDGVVGVFPPLTYNVTMPGVATIADIPEGHFLIREFGFTPGSISAGLRILY